MAEERKCNEQGCSGDCSSCNKAGNAIPKEAGNQYSNVKKVIGIVSGKGGVGKSLVCGMLATLMNRRGYTVGIMDADITGPSIPQMFGIHGSAYQNELGLLPAASKNDIRVIEQIATEEIGMVKSNRVESKYISVAAGERVALPEAAAEEESGVFTTLLSAAGSNWEKIMEYID